MRVEQSVSMSSDSEGSASSPEKMSHPNATDFAQLTKQHIRPLVELNDEINKLTSKERNINSTRIVVAGDQSHGKTSLLEALSGVDLPRGEGIQTRVPLVLQLRNAGATEDEYAQIKVESSDSAPEAISLGEIGPKVREYTERAAGKGKDVRDSPIELKVFRRDQDDLTLVDLPGITRVALSDQAGGDGRKLENLILGMCRRYMEPEESVLLNVVSAMVDFSTSASLQLSRELDPAGKRTMLCVTKVDQHREVGLNGKIATAMDAMDLDPDHVFAVRNRSKKENEESVPLAQVRLLEMAELEGMAEDDDCECGLGVASLSKRLVKIQHDQILETLPKTRNAIEEQITELKSSLEQYGDPVGDAASCRSTAVQLIDKCLHQLQGETVGQAAPVSGNKFGSCEEDEIDISLRIDDWAKLRKGLKGSKFVSASKSMRKFMFTLSVYPRITRVTDDGEEEETAGAFVQLKAPEGVTMKTMLVEFSVSCETGGEIVEEVMEYDFAAETIGRGWQSFLSSKQADAIEESVSFNANIFVKEVQFDPSLVGNSGNECIPLCTHLANLQDGFVSNVDALYTNHHFFSDDFRNEIMREVSICRGGIGLPGAVAPHVPVNIIKKLLLKLPEVVECHREEVFNSCDETLRGTIDAFVDKERYPRLHELLVEKGYELLQKQDETLGKLHNYILEWEQTISSSNHYFMDTVQSIREKIFEDEDDDKPDYLRHLDADDIKAMSNEDQKVVDMQIEIFAYWKLLKKRYVDNIIQSTYSELVNKPFNVELKPFLLGFVFSRNEAAVVQLLSPFGSAARKRAKLEKRLNKLEKALDKIEGIETKEVWENEN